MPTVVLSWISASITFVCLSLFFLAPAKESGKNFIKARKTSILLFLLPGFLFISVLNQNLRCSIPISITVGYLAFNAITDWYDRIIYRASHLIVVAMGVFLVVTGECNILYYLAFLVFLAVASLLGTYAVGDTFEFASCGLILVGLNLNLPDILMFWVISIAFFLVWNLKKLKPEKDEHGKIVLLRDGSPVAPFIYLGFIISLVIKIFFIA